MQHGRNLGGAGIWNFLWRLGMLPGAPTVSGDGHLLLALDGPLSDAMASDLRAKIKSGRGWVIAAGDPTALQALLPPDVTIEGHISPFPRAALGWIGLLGEEPEIVAPPAWPFFRVTGGAEKIETFGELVALGGERQSPERALKITLDAPAAVRCGRLILLNGSPFAALQAWLQSQENLTTWLAWRHGIFWLDEQVEFLADAIERLGFPLADVPAPGVNGLASTTVVLRHDLDSSRDTSLFESAQAAGVVATHATLLDGNTDFWTKTLSAAPAHESAFHFDTLRSDTLIERLRRFGGWRPATEYRPGHAMIAGTGLLKQVRTARSRGIGVRTLHRHASFILYPEFVDALDHVFTEEPDVLGASSYFHGQVLRWGVDRCDGARGTMGGSPYWMPFRTAHAGDGGRLLSGFESMSVMECEPELVAQMLNYRARRLKQRVLTLSYHPFHANRPSFNPNGTLPWFREVIGMLNKRDVQVLTFADVLDRCRRGARIAAEVAEGERDQFSDFTA